MTLYKNTQEADYNILDKQIANHFNSFYDAETFTCLPNPKGYLSNLDWYSLLSQAESHSYEGIISYYENDFRDTIKNENKSLKEIVPQLFKLIEFLKNNNYQITS